MAEFDSNELLVRPTESSPADIPSAVFIESIESFVGNRDPLAILSSLKDLLSKFNFMYESLLAQKRATQRKLPDIQQAIETVEFLKLRHESGEVIKTHFPLTDNCHAKADIAPTNSVCLWLGANVMLEYSIDEAERLLQKSNTNAMDSISSLNQNLTFLRDQITTTEVNIARVHNFMVKIKAQLRALETETAITV